MEKDPQKGGELTRGKYLIELGTRLQEYAKRAVIGGQPTREVDIAGRLLVKIGEEWNEQKRWSEARLDGGR